MQPDYFAKGYEYRDGKIPPKTQEEIDTLKSYGADMLFTPGDVVFSSSKFIEKNKPNLLIEKLLTLMASENVTFDMLRKVLDLFPKYKVHVIGDTIVDSYVFCTPISTGSSKTPMVGIVQLTLGGGSAMPKTRTCCGVPLALSATFSVAVSEPTERLGVNVTLIGQLVSSRHGRAARWARLRKVSSIRS